MNKIAVLLMLILSAFTLHAQTLSKNDALKFDADYYLMEKEFSKAQNNYITILRSEPDNADIKYRLGICYLNSEDEKTKAIAYLEEAVQNISEKYNPSSFKETNAPIDALFLLGSSYRVNNELDKAIEAYSRYKDYLDPKDKYNIEVVDQYIRNCNLARDMLKNPVNMTAINLGKPVNTEMPNFNAVMSGDGKILIYATPGRQGYDIFSTTFADTAWTTPKNITSVLGTGKYMKPADLSYDGLTLLLMLDDPMNADIYACHYTKGRWSKAEPLSKEINGKSNETHASLTADGKTLYFTSDRKGGEGDLDIYKSELDSKGEWGKPVNLGAAINTRFNEETPFVTDDGQKLYFSSEGHNGIGGYDIYYYDFSNPSAGAVNVGYPLNTTDNDLFYAPWGDGTTAYYAYKGSDTYGGRDIYRVKVEKPVEEIATVAIEEVQEVIPEVADIAAEIPAAEILVAEIPAVEEAPSITEPPAEEVVAVEETVLNDEPAIAEEPVTESLAEVQQTIAETEDPVPEAVTPSVINPSSVVRSYKVQVMALRKPVDLAQFPELQGITLAYAGDRWYRYTLGATTAKPVAEKLLEEISGKGYHDAFIRGESIVPYFTIQVMAVPGPVVDLSRFHDLRDISVTKGKDNFCRYTTGEFETKDDAVKNLEEIRKLGYERAFVTKISIQE